MLGQSDEFERPRADTLPRRFEGVDDALTIRFNASMSVPTCAARKSGAVTCWPETPPPLAGQTGILDVVGYGNDVCAVSASGHLRCGESTLDDVPGIPDATAVVASDDEFFALRRSGQIVHVESEGGTFAVTPVDGIADATDLAAAHHSLCILRRSGKVACSDQEFGVAPMPDAAKRPLHEVPGLVDAIAVDVGCAVRASGEAVSWGAPGSSASPIAGVKDARAIACGDGFGCYERSDGAVLCWGGRRSGRLGDGAETTRYEPVQVDGITDARAVVVGHGTCVLRRDGTVACWGRGGLSSSHGVPAEPVPGASGVTSLTSHFDHACAAGAGKPVVCFEAGLPLTSVRRFEGLGDVTKAVAERDGLGVALRSSGEVVLFNVGAAKGTTRPASVVLAGLRDAVDVALSTSRACALRKGGAVVCAELGKVFTSAPPVAPKLVEVSGLGDAIQLTGSIDICALRKTGVTVCVEQSSKKGKVPGGLGTKSPLLGAQTGLVRTADGALSSCGISAQGQIICRTQMGASLQGAGGREWTRGDTRVKDVSAAVDVAIGGAHGCAVLATGRVVCWGSNDGDTLGGGESPISLVPVEVGLGKMP